VDEAEKGLKSALAVKVFGSNLETLQKKAKPSNRSWKRVRGIREVTLVQELGQPSLTIKNQSCPGLPVTDLNVVRHQ